MPSPLNGLTSPAASPTTSMPGVAGGVREKPIGSGPDSTRPSAEVSLTFHSAGSIRQNASNTRCADRSLKSRNVFSSPAPTLIEPSASGNSHP